MTISFLILLISRCKFEIVFSLDFYLENLSKVSSREIFALAGLLMYLIIVFLSFFLSFFFSFFFLRYYSFNLAFSIFEIKIISKSFCSLNLVRIQQVLILLQQESTQPIFILLLENSLAE
jgi:hypothetical protein